MTEPTPGGLRRKPHILFIGPGNTFRTQIAEAYMRNLAPDVVEVRSAGMQSQQINRRAIEVMQADGMNIADQSSKLINAELLTWADIIISISGVGETFNPPIPNGAREKPWSISAPGGEASEPYVETRDEIKKRVKQLINNMRLFKG